MQKTRNDLVQDIFSYPYQHVLQLKYNLNLSLSNFHFLQCMNILYNHKLYFSIWYTLLKIFQNLHFLLNLWVYLHQICFFLIFLKVRQIAPRLLLYADII